MANIPDNRNISDVDDVNSNSEEEMPKSESEVTQGKVKKLLPNPLTVQPRAKTKRICAGKQETGRHLKILALKSNC